MGTITRLVCGVVLAANLSLLGGDSLSKAASNGNLSAVKNYMAAGEKVNDTDKWGWTALHWTVYYQQEALTKWLLTNGADPNARSTKPWKTFPQGITPLWMAGYYGLDNLVSPLMAAKANPNIKDGKGVSPREIALSFEFQECVDLMDGKPTSKALNAAIPGKLTDLYILIRSGLPKSQDFLGNLKTKLDYELNGRKVRCLIHVEDPLSLEDARLEGDVKAFKPRYVLLWEETAGSPDGKGRSHSMMHASLSRPEGGNRIWQRDTEVKAIPFLDSTSPDEMSMKAVTALLTEMEGDNLF